MKESVKSFTGSIIGMDFSVNKPACCVFHNNEYIFYGWPYNLNSKLKNTYINSNVNIIDREDNKEQGVDLSSKMRYEVEDAIYLSRLIKNTLNSYLNSTTLISFEGLSYGSGGDYGIQLGAYKYMLMYILSENVPMSNMFTYSPQTIKSIAGCAKKGMGKPDMIKAFITNGPQCKFIETLRNNPEVLQTPKAKNWCEHVDDLVDSYYALETLRIKENNYLN